MTDETGGEKVAARRIPLRLLLIFLFVVQIALVVGLTGYLSYRNGRRAVNEVAGDLRSEITARIVAHLQTFLQTPHYINETNAEILRKGWLDLDDVGALERHFWEQVQVFDSVSSIYLGTPAGGLVDAGREGAGGSFYFIVTDGLAAGPFQKYAADADGRRASLLQTIPDFDARTRPWYARAVETGHAVWSDPYILFTNQDMAIAASRPVIDQDGVFLGVVSTDVFLSHLSDFLKHLEVGRTGYSFIIERSGALVASSADESPIITVEGGAPSRLLATQSSVPLIRDTARFLDETFSGYMRINGTQSLVFEADVGRCYVQVAPIQDAYGIDWLAVVVIPESDFVAQIEANDRTIPIIILAILIATLLGILTTEWLIRPIQKLNVAVRALARGELHPLARTSWIAEVSEMTGSFTEMAGQLQETLADLTDEVAERQRSETALRESEERYRLLVETTRDIIVLHDMQGRITYVNPVVFDLTGYRPADLIGRSLLEFIPKERLGELEARRSQRADGDLLTYRYETEFVCTDGRTSPVEVDSTPVVKVGDIREVLIVARDITDRRRAEVALRESEGRLRQQARQVQQVLATVPSGVALLDWQGRVLQVNPVAERALDALSGASVGDVLKRLGDRPLEEVLSPAPVEGLWHEVRTKGRIFEAIARPVVESNGDEVGENNARRWVLVLNDVTQERQIRDELHQQERLAALGHIAAGIAHDFNNIMTSIVLYAQMTERSSDLSERNRERMSVIIEQAWHATRLIEQILDFSRRAVLTRRPLNLAPLLEAHVALLARTLPEHIKIDFVTHGNGPYIVNADPTRIQQMLTNLAVNARDAMPDGGVLSISLAQVTPDESWRSGTGSPAAPADRMPEKPGQIGAWIRLTVRDTGQGIAPDVLPHIFEPFFTTKGPGAGSGLGLAQVHGIAGLHGGWVEVSTALGEGTTFDIYLPALASEQVAPLEHRTLDMPLGRGEHMLVVEDNAAVRAALVKSLTQLNYQVTDVSNGEVALAVMADRGAEIALVLSDVIMPVMGGVALLHALRAQGWQIPVILLTGHPMDSELAPLRVQGLSAWLTKPPSLEQLAQALHAALHQPES